MRDLVLVSGMIVAMGLAACGTLDQGAATVPQSASDACGASGYQGLIGQSRDVLTAMQLPEGVRIIGPADAVTADYSVKRLNVEYDENGVIEKISCF